MKQASSANKEFGFLTKKLAQGEAIVSTYQAATKAFAKAGGYPAGVIPAAASIAIGEFFNVTAQNIKAAIEHFIPANNRSQLIEKEMSFQ